MITAPTSGGLPNVGIDLASGVLSSVSSPGGAWPEEPCAEYNDGNLLTLNKGLNWAADGQIYGASSTMSAGSRIIAGTEQRYIALTDQGFTRQITMPAAWLSLRICMLIGFTDSGGNITTPNFMAGLCAGHAARWAGGDVQHWVGLAAREDSGLTWTRVANYGGYYSATSGVRPCRVEGDGTPEVGTANNHWMPFNDGLEYYGHRRFPWCIQFDKSGSDLLVAGWFPGTQTYLATDMPWAHALELGNLPDGTTSFVSRGGALINRGTVKTFATFDEGTYGELDTFNVYWNKSDPVELYGILVQFLA